MRPNSQKNKFNYSIQKYYVLIIINAQIKK